MEPPGIPGRFILVNSNILANVTNSTLTNQNGAVLQNFATMFSQTGAVLTNTSAVIVNESGATLANIGTTLTNQAGAALINATGAAIQNQSGSVLRNTGDSSIENQSGAAIANVATATIINELGSAVFNDGVLGNGGSIVNSGSFLVGLSDVAGSVIGNGIYTQTDGILTVNGTITQSLIECKGGKVNGTGLFSTITNRGCEIGAGNSPGTLTIDGDLLFESGLLKVEVGGLVAGQFDVLKISGTALFSGGTIEFDFLNGFMPKAGDMFPFLLADVITGLEHVAFTTTGLAPGVSFDVRSGLSGELNLIIGTPQTAVPLPGTLALVSGGLVGLVCSRHKKWFRTGKG